MVFLELEEKIIPLAFRGQKPPMFIQSPSGTVGS
jgi:hypothetical protein